MRSLLKGLIGAALLLTAAILPARAENPDAIAIIIGNKNYKPPIPPVDYADNDAAAMKKFAIETLGYREGNVVVLNDATGAQLNAAFGTEKYPGGRLRNLVKPGKSDVLVYYSGHGVPGLRDKRGYLLPVDGDPSLVEDTGYPLDQLYANLAQIGARSVTVYLDACFSGEFAKGTLVKGASGIAIVPTLPKAAGTLTVITAAQADQVASWDDDDRHGLFTYFLLAALSGEANKGGREVTLGQVKAYLDDKLTYEARRRFNREQVAYVQGDDAAVLASVTPEAPKPAPVATAPQPAVDKEAMFWDAIKTSTDPADFQAYLDKFGEGGTFAPLAKNRLADLHPKQQVAATAPPPAPARTASEIAGRDVLIDAARYYANGDYEDAATKYRAYLELAPTGSFAATARNRLADIEARQRVAGVVAPPPPAPAHGPPRPGGSADAAGTTIEPLGFAVSAITPALRQRYSLHPDIRGIVVTDVRPGSVAAEKALQPGDVIVEAMQESVAGPTDLIRVATATARAGRKTLLLLVQKSAGLIFVPLRFPGG